MGPTCAIILDRTIDFQMTNQVDDFLKRIINGDLKTPKISRDFWVDKRKFPKITSKGSDCLFNLSYDNKLKLMGEDEIVELDLALNFKAKSMIVISAGCNQQGDHNVLAELILEVAKLTGGLIDFGYDISKYDSESKKILEGMKYDIKFNHDMAIKSFVDIEYFGKWLENNKNKVRMVK